MPIKEIMFFSAGILATIFATSGPANFHNAIQKAKIQILREVGRTDNWGNPSIFRHKRTSLTSAR